MSVEGSTVTSDVSERPPAQRSVARNPLPAICDVSVTNVCNAACDFCGFARDKNLSGPARYLDPNRFAQALPILRRRRIRYMNFQGGEPLVHPQIESLVCAATRAGMHCGLITNGWFLSQRIATLAESGLKRLLISIDSDSMPKHEANRGLCGLRGRIEDGISRARAAGLAPVACVTVNRLVDYAGLPETLGKLGFEAVTFSYPRRAAFGSTSLVYSEDSPLLDQPLEELLDTMEKIRELKKRFPVMNPSTALTEVSRFLKGEPQVIPCIGGHKYFYIDWNLDIWRCEAWTEPMGSVFDLDSFPDQREPCHECMMACYRHASIMMHGPIALTDSIQALARGDLRSAIHALFQRGVGASWRTLLSERWPRMSLFSRGSHSTRAAHADPQC